jgi:predicted ATPase/class 3 adenylate cyclase
VSDVRQWLEGLGLGQYADMFAENDVDFDVLTELSDDELKELGLSLGHRKKLLKAVDNLSDGPGVTETPGTPPNKSETQSATVEAERRQLTVMFCDLVGSTAFSQHLDPEDLRELMRHYQDAVAGAVTRYGGHIAKYLGDGVLVYFGWPQAYEDQAERAVWAGLDAVQAVQAVRSEGGGHLASRVGIASGEVIVGDLVSDMAKDADAVTGETPNLAARLQAIAEPDQVIVGDMTRELIGQAFQLSALPPQRLKGFDEVVPAWRVTGVAAGENRFEATQGQALLPFVGRQGELNMLLDRWEIVLDGEGQVVMVSGEAGIGKSRLVQAFYEKISGQQYTRVRYQCAPYHTNSAYYPIIRQLENAAGLAPDDGVEAKLDKLEALFGESGSGDAQTAPRTTPLIASLLSIPFEDRFGISEISPQQRKQQTETAIIEQLLSLARQTPMLLIFEDIHWADPSTRELLEQTLARIVDVPVLFIITHRPEFTAPWLEQQHVTQLNVRRLSQSQVEEMIRAQIGEMIRRAGGAELPIDKMAHIVEHADGVPLYIEELTHTIIGADVKITGAEVPASLQASLTARLDQLGPAKRTAEVAAVIGREVPHDLLTAVSKKPEDELRDDLETLLSSGLLQRTERGSGMSYLFKHALIQDTAYQMLLRARRQEIHRAVATALEEHFPNRAETEPELLAHHFDAGREPERAAHLWLRAGRQSLARSAVAEASAQAEQGIAALRQMDESHERDSLEVDLQSCLALASMAHRGYGAEETEQPFQRARELLAAFDEDPRHISVLHGFCALLGTQARLHDYLDISSELLDRAERSGDSEAICVGHRCMAVGYNSRGEFTEAHAAGRKAIEYFDPTKHRQSAQRFGHDVGVAAKMHLAIATQFLGYGHQAARLIEDALALAHEIKHPNTLGFAHFWAGFLRLSARDLTATRENAQELEEISREAVNPNWFQHSQFQGGAALAACVETAADGVELIATTAATVSSGYIIPTYLCCQAEGLLNLTRYDEAAELIEQCLRLVNETAERWWEAEMHRIGGEIQCAQGCEAGVYFERALGVARRQAAKPLELRAATSLAELWHKQGKTVEARNLLAPIYDWFTEGFDTADLLLAKALLARLGGNDETYNHSSERIQGGRHEYS